MATRDVYEWVRDGCGDAIPRRWSVWQPKIYARDDGQMGKFGIKIFPDSDIRDRIEHHRQIMIAQETESAEPQGGTAPIAEAR